MPTDNLNQETDTSNQPEPIAAPQWREHIPTDLRDKGVWKPVENADLGTVLKNYANAQERLGRSISIPEKSDDKEGWDKVFTRLGRPDGPDKYQYEIPKIDGVDWSPESFSEFNVTAHKAGLTNDQVSQVVGWMGENLKGKIKEQTDKAAETAAITEVKLKNELGKNYDMKYALARRAGINYFGEEITDELLTGMNEKVVRGLITLGSQLAEDKAFGENPVELRGAVSKEDALRQIAEIGSNRDNPYWKPNDPRHQEAQDTMTQLHKIAFPEL